MEPANPYTSPQSNLFGGSAGASGDIVARGVMLQLQKTRPWVRFMSVMMFIAAAFLVMAALMMGVFGAAGMMRQPAGSPFGDKISPGIFVGAIAAIYGCMAILYIYPALKLWKYADRIRDMCGSMQVVDLEKALNEQRAFWKFVGVMVIAMIALYFVFVVVLVGVGVGSAVKFAH